MTKSETIAKIRKSPKDVGSSSVQIALLTERIKQISEHLKNHRKDYTSQVGLMKLVGQRRRLLNYLKRTDTEEYARLLKRLDIRK
jgi:small subunit ribosomal protein S15